MHRATPMSMRESYDPGEKFLAWREKVEKAEHELQMLQDKLEQLGPHHPEGRHVPAAIRRKQAEIQRLENKRDRLRQDWEDRRLGGPGESHD